MPISVWFLWNLVWKSRMESKAFMQCLKWSGQFSNQYAKPTTPAKITAKAIFAYSCPSLVKLAGRLRIESKDRIQSLKEFGLFSYLPAHPTTPAVITPNPNFFNFTPVLVKCGIEDKKWRVKLKFKIWRGWDGFFHSPPHPINQAKPTWDANFAKFGLIQYGSKEWRV